MSAKRPSTAPLSSRVSSLTLKTRAWFEARGAARAKRSNWLEDLAPGPGGGVLMLRYSPPIFRRCDLDFTLSSSSGAVIEITCSNSWRALSASTLRST